MALSIIHVLWVCPAYSSCTDIIGQLQELLGDKYSDFGNQEKISYMLGSAEKDFRYLLLI